MNKLIKVISIITIILFFSLFLSRYNSYYENKSVLTDSAIERFEQDLKDGKEIIASNYIEEEKDYNNKAAKAGIKASKIIENSFNKILKGMMKYFEKIQ